MGETERALYRGDSFVFLHGDLDGHFQRLGLGLEVCGL
jgi:hypothetical protein